MPFENEKAFEEHIRKLIKENILPLNKDLVLFDNKKAVDILICKNGKKPALFFLEIKYHKRSHGRLSTGHGKGGGFQPEIISKLPIYFEHNMRWILGVEDIEGYFFLRNSQIKGYVSGGSVGKKFNNFKVKLFNDELCLKEKKLIFELKEWLCK